MTESISKTRHPGCTAARSGAVLIRGYGQKQKGPGSAQQHCVLQRVRDDEKKHQTRLTPLTPPHSRKGRGGTAHA
jgi:hypothetical protein